MQKAEIAAGGTLPRGPDIASPSAPRRAWLVAEMLIAFIGAPLVMRYAVFEHRVPLFLALPPVLIAITAFLLYDRTFSVRRELSVGITWRSIASILVMFAVGASAVAWAVHAYMPERYLALPLQRPDTWLKILMLYPFTSVLAQEFVFRTFFFHRYGPLFGRRVWLMILVNATAFAISHILFRNWIAVGGTFVSGLLFARRYQVSRSFWTVWLEHTLWGYLVFTIGIGVFFFTGNRNPMW